MLKIGATMALTSRPEEVKGGINGKLGLGVVTGRDVIGTLFVIRLAEVSKANEAAWIGGKVDGKAVEVRFKLLLTGGNKGEGNSGIFGRPVGSDVFILGYCIGCCME